MCNYSYDLFVANIVFLCFIGQLYDREFSFLGLRIFIYGDSKYPKIHCLFRTNGFWKSPGYESGECLNTLQHSWRSKKKKRGEGENRHAQSTFCLLFAGVHLLQQDEHNCRRASSRGLIPRAKIKSVKMTFVIVFGKPYHELPQSWQLR